LGKTFPKQEDAIRPDEVRIGRVSGVFGISGELRLFLHNRESQIFSKKGMDVILVSPEGERESRHLATRQGSNRRVLAKIAGVSTPEGARALMGWEIVVEASALPKPATDEYYLRDLIGLLVKTQDGDVVGTITEVMEGERIDCWVVKGPQGELIFPAVKEVVISVDLNEGVVISTPLKDLSA
jgi:16S rRNA processing protein RimM